MTADRDALLDLLGAAERITYRSTNRDMDNLRDAIDRVRRHLDRERNQPPVKVGDVDTTPYGSEGRASAMCAAKGHDPKSPTHPWTCTLAKGHGDWHIAGDGDEVCAVWPV